MESSADWLDRRRCVQQIRSIGENRRSVSGRLGRVLRTPQGDPSLREAVGKGERKNPKRFRLTVLQNRSVTAFRYALPLFWRKLIMRNKILMLLFSALFVIRSGAGAQTKTAAVEAEGHQWWQHAVFYEIYPRSFADSNNDGVGHLKGIASKLDYLKDLGVDAIWITPCFPSPQVDFGYDVSDYENIDPMYGTLADFDNLVSGAKKRDIRVILDFVVNHSSDRHKWFMDSKSSRT